MFHLFYRLTQVMQVLVTTFCSLRESCHKCLFNLFYKCLQVVTSACLTCFTSVYKLSQVDLSTCVSLRKLMQAYAGWVMLGQVRVMLGQVGSCWDRSESCLCVTTFWPVPYCDFDHVRVMLSTCFALFLIVIWCVTTFYLVPYCDFDHVPT